MITNKEIEADGFITPQREILKENNVVIVGNKYTNKLHIVDAIQWDGNDVDSIIRFCGDAINIELWIGLNTPGVYKLTLTTPYGNVHVLQKDYIIKINNNEFTTCQPKVFETLYERI